MAPYCKKVYGVEIVEAAVKDANRNAELNGVENVEFIAAAAEKALPELVENGVSASIIVADPPRKGCEPEALAAFIAFGAKKIIYVSCDPATLARDSKILAVAGYRVKKMQPIDMFPMTSHIETVALLER
jgi:23S rRNA (uracil1939-C5)-methyltransferase